MDANEKKLAAALRRGNGLYPDRRGSMVMPAPKRPEPRRFDQGNLWGCPAGRA
jgi:hypothetical protein